MPAGNLLYWAVVALIIAVIAAVLSFGGIAGTAAGIAKLLFYIFIVIFLVVLVMNFIGRGSPAFLIRGIVFSVRPCASGKPSSLPRWRRTSGAGVAARRAAVGMLIKPTSGSRGVQRGAPFAFCLPLAC